jgi:YVTN family beta-propeller protein
MRIIRFGSCVLVFSLTFLPARARPQESQPSAPAVPRNNLQAPAGNLPTRIDPRGMGVLPNGRLLTPYGKYVMVAPHPYGLAISPDGKTLVTVNSGTDPFSASIVTDLFGLTPQVAQIPPGVHSSDADPASVFLGASVAPDNQTLYLSEGNNGKVGIFDLASHQRLGSISLDGAFGGVTYKDSLPGELKLGPGGRYLYVLDLGHYRLVVIDNSAKQVVGSIPVGRMPFGLDVSPDGKRVYVSNVGTFDYKLVPGYDPDDPRDTAITFPAFGYPSPEATSGTTVEGKQIAGLGDPNVPESNSLYIVNVKNPMHPHVLYKIPTGLPIGGAVVGGSSPGAVVAGRKKIFVSNATQDIITVINAHTGKVERNVLLAPATSMQGLRGVLPFGMALSHDDARLYVACAGINAVAVINTRDMMILGYVPTAWFPARVALSPDDRTLFISNAKGFGAGPNGGKNFHPGPEGSYIGDITKGVVSIAPVPKDYDLHPMTLQVLRNNGFVEGYTALGQPTAPPHPPYFPLPGPGQPEPRIHHVVFIVKENRTFDEILGDLKGVNGDPELARWGTDSTLQEKGLPEIEHARVTPNEHALAERFATSDNFYVDSDVSADGHHWIVGNYPNEVMETGWPAAYGGQLDWKPDADAPGRLTLGGTTPRPETYLENGSIWENLARSHVTFRNYGEGLELPGNDEGAGEYPTGSRQSLNMPMPKALFDNTSRDFPTFNTNISDQYRFAQFKKEFEERYASGKEPLPQFIFMWLPNDHTADPRPGDGFPYRASYVEDNDLAFGKLVELFSHSPFWNDMAIFVTEDDAQGGEDHIDAHRSLLFVVSPFAKPGWVSHVHTSMESILKTIDLLLGMPYLNQYDAASTDLSDMFTSTPDLTPYTALTSDTRIFDPAKVKEPGLNAKPGAALDNPDEMRKQVNGQQEPKN